ncbi:MAG: YciI family protein [Dermatophilaceae bacterium]
MTQYLLSVHSREGDPEPDADTIKKMYADVDAFNSELQSNGAWVFAGGLHPVDTATVVDGRGSDVLVTDGPFAESKEHLGGFWVLNAGDLDAAIALAARASAACGAPVEVRPFMDEPPA